jgi:hypothetical protein
MDEHDAGPANRESFEAEAHRGLSRFSAMHRRDETASFACPGGDGLGIGVRVLGVDRDSDRVDPRVAHERLERPVKNCPARENPVLLGPPGARSGTATGGNDQGCDCHAVMAGSGRRCRKA